MTDNPMIRFRVYLRSDTIALLNYVREVTSLPAGRVLLSFLEESETFLKLSKADFFDLTDEKVKDILGGLPFQIEKCNNAEKKEIR